MFSWILIVLKGLIDWLKITEKQSNNRIVLLTENESFKARLEQESMKKIEYETDQERLEKCSQHLSTNKRQKMSDGKLNHASLMYPFKTINDTKKSKIVH